MRLLTERDPVMMDNGYLKQLKDVGGDPYTLPKASASTLGGIKVGDNLTIEDDGTLNGESYTLPIASSEALGGIKVGDNLTIDENGTLSADNDTANNVSYDNTDSGLSATTVQGAIDVLNSKIATQTVSANYSSSHFTQLEDANFYVKNNVLYASGLIQSNGTTIHSGDVLLTFSGITADGVSYVLFTQVGGGKSFIGAIYNESGTVQAVTDPTTQPGNTEYYIFTVTAKIN